MTSKAINPILERWNDVLSTGTGPAVYSMSGEVLRTWSDIGAEAEDLLRRMPAGSGAVALQTGNHESFPAMLLAAWCAGRAVCLFDGDLQGGGRGDMERELGATVRVCVTKGKLEFEPTGASALPPCGVDLYKLTSGTVAHPRALGFTAAQLLADCDHICETMGIRADDLNFGVIAFSHSYGFSNLIAPLLCRGIRLVVAPDALPGAMVSGLVASGASVFPAVPALFRGLLSVPALPESLRLCISAGAPLDPELGKEFHARFGRKIHTFYGASECGGICYDATEEVVGKPGFVGLPLSGVQIEMKEDVSPSRIRVHSDAVGVEGGSFEPTDLLVLDADGFWIVGREGEQINVAGKKVNPGEIERVIASAPGVREAVVCGVEDPARGHAICALVAGEGDSAALRRHCRSLLAPWKVPRRYTFVSEIPVNARGKVSRKEIARLFFGAG